MKKWIIGMMAASFALSASADVLQEWKYDDGVDTTLHNAANTGTQGVNWNWGDSAKWITDTAGNLNMPGAAGNDWKDTVDFTALSGANTYSMEIKLGAWDIPAAAGNAQVKWRLRDSAGGNIMEIQTAMSSAGMSFTLVSGATNYRNISAGGLTGSGATARVDFNLAAGTAAYFVNGVAGETFSGLTFGNGSLVDFGMSREGAWTDGARVVNIDEQSLSVVPEPATLGLVAFVGAGLLFVRRRFKS